MSTAPAIPLDRLAPLRLTAAGRVEPQIGDLAGVGVDSGSQERGRGIDSPPIESPATEPVRAEPEGIETGDAPVGEAAPKVLEGRWSWIAGTVLLALAGITAWLAVSDRLPQVPITSVRITGAFQHLPRPALEAAIAPHLLRGFFAVDLTAVREAARDLPWVKEAAVRRVWPGGLDVAVVERRAFARWAPGGLVDADGVLFRPAAASYPADLVLLDGPPGAAGRMLEQHRVLEDALAPAGRKLRRLHLDLSRGWEATLDGDLVVVIGHELSAEKVARFARTYPALAKDPRAPAVRVDLRYANGFAVRWKAPPVDETQPDTETTGARGGKENG